MLMCFHKNPTITPHLTVGSVHGQLSPRTGPGLAALKQRTLLKVITAVWQKRRGQYDCLHHCTSQRMIVSFSRSSMDIKFDPNGNRTLPKSAVSSAECRLFYQIIKEPRQVYSRGSVE